jgi:hypothetical protein
MLFVKYAIRSQHLLAMTPGNWWNTIKNFKQDILIESFLALLKKRLPRSRFRHDDRILRKAKAVTGLEGKDVYVLALVSEVL